MANYGIKVSNRPSTPTVRLANFEMLARLLEGGLPIPIDILLESMDFAHKDEVIQRIKQQQEQAQAMEQQQAQQGQQPKGKASSPKQTSMVGKV